MVFDNDGNFSMVHMDSAFQITALKELLDDNLVAAFFFDERKCLEHVNSTAGKLKSELGLRLPDRCTLSGFLIHVHADDEDVMKVMLETCLFKEIHDIHIKHGNNRYKLNFKCLEYLNPSFPPGVLVTCIPLPVSEQPKAEFFLKKWCSLLHSFLPFWSVASKKSCSRFLFQSLKPLIGSIDFFPNGIIFEDYNHNMILVNQAAIDLYGLEHLSFKVLKGKNYFTFITRKNNVFKDYDRFKYESNMICKTKNPVFSNKILLKDGRVLERDYVPIVSNGQLLGHLWNIKDVTRRIKTELKNELINSFSEKIFHLENMEKGMLALAHLLLNMDEITGVAVFIYDDNKSSFCSYTSFFYGELPFHLIDKKLFSANPNHITSTILSNKEASDILNRDDRTIVQIPVIYNNEIFAFYQVAFSRHINWDIVLKPVIEALINRFASYFIKLKYEMQIINLHNNLHHLFSSLDDCIMVFDLAGNVLHVNSAFEKMMNLQKSEWTKLNFQDIYFQLEFGEFDSMLENIQGLFLDEFKCSNGNIVPVETRLVKGQWNYKPALFAIVRDISERVSASRNLRQSEARWQIATECSGDGIWDWDLVKDRIFFSKQWKEMLGYEQNEISEDLSEWFSRVHPDDIKGLKQKIDSCIQDASVLLDHEHRMLCKDGAYIWILVRGKVIDQQMSNKTERFIGTFSNINSRVELENSLRRSLEQEKEISQIRSGFVSMASHEFRTPLATILMSADSLISYLEVMTKDKKKEKLQKIIDNVMVLRNIIDKVLNLSYVESGKLKLIFKEFDLSHLLRDLICEIKDSPLYRNREIVQMPYPEAIIKADQQIIKHAFYNILENALKYSDPNSSVIISIEKADEYYCVNFIDSGIGIPKEDLDHIIQPFHRGSNTSNFNGTGIGMALSHRFIEMHMGFIRLNSTLGKGTHAKVFLLHA